MSNRELSYEISSPSEAETPASPILEAPPLYQMPDPPDHFGPSPTLGAPQVIATIVVKGGVEFPVYKDLLTRDSSFFRAALESSWCQAPLPVKLWLDGVSAHWFGLYVHVVHVHTLAGMHRDFRLRPWHLDPAESGWNVRSLLALWDIARLVLNQTIAHIAEEAMWHHLSVYSKPGWDDIFVAESAEDIRRRFADLQAALEFCTQWELTAWADFMLERIANMPAQVFVLLAPEMDKDVLCRVSMEWSMQRRSKRLDKTKQRMEEAADEGEAEAVYREHKRRRVD